MLIFWEAGLQKSVDLMALDKKHMEITQNRDDKVSGMWDWDCFRVIVSAYKWVMGYGHFNGVVFFFFLFLC